MWLIQSVALTVTFLLSVIAHLIPALFQVFVWLTRFAFVLVFRITGRPMAFGGLVLLSGVIYSAMTLLLIPFALIVMPVGIAFAILCTAGGIWGLCVGYQAALLWQAELLRLPDTNTQRLFGIPDSFFRSPSSPSRGRTEENVFQDGIVLGETGEWDDRG